MKTLTIDKAIMMEEVRTLVSEGKTVTLTVKGQSMSPFIVHLRDQLTLGGFKDEDIRPGAVALVKDIHGNYLIHRIVKREGDRVVLMGDGNIGQKEVALMPDVIALLHSIDRKGKTYQVYPSACFTWRIYSWFWHLVTPLRRYFLGLWRRLR